MALVQTQYPGYSDSANAISDLGNRVWSPWAPLFNISVILLGLTGAAGTAMVRSALPARRTSRVGIGLVLLGFVSAIGVGLFPENSAASLHTLFSFLTFLLGGLGLLVLSVAMLRDTRWANFRLYTLLSGVVSLAALAALAIASNSLTNAGHYGLVERVVVAPLLLWAVLAGVHLLRIPAYAPSAYAMDV
jgi:hypothetical membrane protein